MKPSKKFLMLYAMAFAGAFAALLAPTMVSLALRISQIAPEQKASGLAMVLGFGAFAALLANPIFGRLSDRSGSKHGRRRPFILGGGSLATIGLVILPFMQTVMGIVIVFVFVQVASNAMLAALNAVMADQVPEEYRGSAGGAAAIGGSLGTLLGVIVASSLSFNPFLMFIVPGLLGFVTSLVFALTMRDEPIAQTQDNVGLLQGVLASFAFNPKAAPDFTRILLARFLILVGISIITSYQIYYMQDRLMWSASKIAMMVNLVYLVAGVTAITGNAVAGNWADKLHRYKPFMVGASIAFSIVAILLAFFTNFWVLMVVVAVLGMAQGIVNTLGNVMTSLVMPDQKESGKWLGIGNIAATLPQSVAPAIAPIFLGIGVAGNNYTALFIAAAVITLIGAVFVRTMKTIK